MAQEKEDGADNLIAYRGKHAYVILNRFPYTSGHLMVVPFYHQATLEDLEPATRAEMMELTTRGMAVLRRLYKPPAFNMGANIGEAAGAGVKAHVHIHIVPRWAGDTNFMSTVGEVRVLPELLEDTYRRVRKGFLE
jgi:ATP adenylyltransferase